MEKVRAYLESGSINGLNHIVATKKWDRLFWILVVNMGFIISTFLLVEMYISWADNPIRTDVDTLPMSEVRFPKVTVCPPKDTFTDLNYDIKRAEERNLTFEEREELYEYARDTIDSISFMENLNKLHDEDRFYNWYYAISEVYSGPLMRTLLTKSNYINYYSMTTKATSGVITSNFFGKKFDSNQIETEKNAIVLIYVQPHDNFLGNEKNLTLNFHLEKVSVPGLSGNMGSSHIYFFPGIGQLPDDQNTAHSTFTTKANEWDITQFSVSLDLDNVDIRDLEMEQMPGFRFSWWYTGGELEGENTYIDGWTADDILTTYYEFVRTVYI